MGSPLGWALGSPKPDQLNSRLREAPLWFASQMLRVLFTRPRLIWQLFVSARSASMPMTEGAVELTYIGVDASARKQGLGRELLNVFIQAARAAKYKSVLLSVEAENEEAIALYTKAGFRTLNSYTEGSFKRHRMELTL
jgi:ribosomal protein S18 acetylase RimI-like enzyme